MSAQCLRCHLRMDLCYCALVKRVATRTRVSLVTHVRERIKTSNTGRLLEQILPAARAVVIGRRAARPDLKQLLGGECETWLLYPEESAAVLNAALVQSCQRPVHLIVPDGTWHQAKRIAHNHPEFYGLRRVRLPVESPSIYRLRRRGRPGGLCTAEAVARALGEIEGAAVEARIMELLDAMVTRVLWSRSTSEPFKAPGQLFPVVAALP